MRWEISDFLSMSAIIISILPYLTKFLKRAKIDVFMFGDTYLHYDSYGSYMRSNFYIQSTKDDITINEITMNVIKQNSESSLQMTWGDMLPIDSKFVDMESKKKRAHPVKVSNRSIEPFSIEFHTDYGSDHNKSINNYRQKARTDDKEFNDIVKSKFFWKTGTYNAEGDVRYNKKRHCKFEFSFNVIEYDEQLLLSNIPDILNHSGHYREARVNNICNSLPMKIDGQIPLIKKLYKIFTLK